ncbi:hypothetical protein BUALT_Bualt03G0224500 [Buddleja alternifolia]|uniref:Transcription factor CBF/NF-Y/archaeal histone domain-containing protein n=1 Tax=Buddleja alternifolia TaxID=168488 RepID=A0AAV6Y2G6_9LAMI|nr:hypothetical protein BUALT_Bualt03G0224500 [Buddleja alternifolia]
MTFMAGGKEDLTDKERRGNQGGKVGPNVKPSYDKNVSKVWKKTEEKNLGSRFNVLVNEETELDQGVGESSTQEEIDPMAETGFSNPVKLAFPAISTKKTIQELHFHDNANNLNDLPQQSFKRDTDQYMPLAKVTRIMCSILQAHAKIADDAKEIMQECVSEFISFITSEANQRRSASSVHQPEAHVAQPPPSTMGHSSSLPGAPIVGSSNYFGLPQINDNYMGNQGSGEDSSGNLQFDPFRPFK